VLEGYKNLVELIEHFLVGLKIQVARKVCQPRQGRNICGAGVQKNVFQRHRRHIGIGTKGIRRSQENGCGVRYEWSAGL
jgi:hypothetical protein